MSIEYIMGFRFVGATLTTNVDRISAAGNALVELDDGSHINLGPVPHILDPVEITITAVDPYLQGSITLDDIHHLTLIPTNESATESTLDTNDKPVTVLNFGSTEVMVMERLAVGHEVTLNFKRASANEIQAYFIAQKSSSDKANVQGNKSKTEMKTQKSASTSNSSKRKTTVDGVEVDTLVGQLSKFTASGKSSKPRNTVGEKGTCKCCGTQVDPGTHRCGLCQQAGCSPWKRRCRFA